MRSLILTALLTALLGIILACGPGATVNNNSGCAPGVGANGSPTEAYKQLYAAVKSKDTEQIKAIMTKSSQGFAEMVAARQNSPIEKVYENGFTATTFSESLPPIRDERIKCEFGAVEVWNEKDKRWEDLGFIYEDAAWKFAIGEMFGGKFQSPGVGRAVKEQEAANALNPTNNMINAMPSNANNSNVKMIIPKERPEPTNSNNSNVKMIMPKGQPVPTNK